MSAERIGLANKWPSRLKKVKFEIFCFFCSGQFKSQAQMDTVWFIFSDAENVLREHPCRFTQLKEYVESVDEQSGGSPDTGDSDNGSENGDLVTSQQPFETSAKSTPPGKLRVDIDTPADEYMCVHLYMI